LKRLLLPAALGFLAGAALGAGFCRRLARDEAAFREARAEDRAGAVDALRLRLDALTQSLEESKREHDAFAYSISHDLRAPLRALQGFAQILEEDCGPALGEDGRMYTRRIMAAAARLQGLIDDLLRYSRLSRMEFSMGPVALGGAVDEALQKLHGDIRAKEARVEVLRPLPSVMAHRGILVQVVVSLIDNALKFVDGRRPEARILAEQRDARVRLWVEDQGIGIAPEHRARIFEVFERLHGAEAYPGTGIGLSIVKRGVTRMGGDVGVSSALGEGSRFWIDLDAAAIE
jgi:signal transduction histidine kinase